MEKPKCSANSLKQTQKDKLAAIQNEITRNTSLLNRQGIKTETFGEKNIPLPAYKKIPNHLTPKEYFRHLTSLIDSPKDIRKAINKPICEWKQDDPKSDKLNNAEDVLAKGGDDCDNLSWLAKRLFDKLGCKNGHDYKARVIGKSIHAVCIFEDQDGKLYILDQKAGIKRYTNLKKASIFFESEEEQPFELQLNENKNARLNIYIDENLNDKHTKLVAQIYDKYDGKNFKVEKYLPEDWDKYQNLELQFQNKFTLFYEKGKLTQKTLPNGTKQLYTKGQITEKVYPNKERDEYHYDKDGKLTQKVYAKSNSIKYENYHPDGKTVKDRTFKKWDKNEDESIYETIWYNKKGEPTDAKNWDGSMETGPIIIPF